MMESLASSTLSRLETEDASVCWPWPGAVNNKGYGLIRVDGKPGPWAMVHRVVFEALVGPIPEGLVLDHVCHNVDLTCAGGDGCQHRRCCNPAHMEPVTIGENARRGALRRDRCVAGHLYEEHGYVLATTGERRCRTCERERDRVRRPDRYKAAA